MVLGAVGWWRHHATAAAVFGTLAVLLLLAGLLLPTRLGPVQRGWMALAHAISKITTPIFMGVLYFVVLTPAGLLMRLLGRNPLRHKGAGGGFWVSHAAADDQRAGMERQF